MSFFAANDRIHITNDAGKVIFDTNKPMPHIVQTITGRVTVSFPKIPCTYWDRMDNMGPSPICAQTETVCEWKTVCGYENVCQYMWVSDPTFPGGGRMEYVCAPEYRCNLQNVCEPKSVPKDRYFISQGFDYAAHNWEQTSVLGNISGAINADFLLVNAVASRTAQGSLADMGALPCGLPLGQTFVANGSSVIETMSDIRDGSPWMTRIMSVFVEGGQVKVQFKHSNRDFRAISAWQGTVCSFQNIPPYIGAIPQVPPQGESSFSFDLTVQVGKFTI